MSRCEVFSIGEGGRVVLYGLNGNSERLTRILRSGRVTVEGIIDRSFRPDTHGGERTVSVDGRPVPALAIDDRLRLYSGCPAVICLNNGMLHRQVARLLRSYGYDKIVYLSMDGLTPQNDAGLIRRAYLYLMNGDLDRARDIPCYRETDVPVIDRGRDWVSFWCPERLVHTYSREMLEESEFKLSSAQRAAMLPYCGVPLSEYGPYVDLFRYLAGSEGTDISPYLRQLREREEDRGALLADRKKLFEAYRYALTHDLAFFTDSPTRARYDPGKDRFYVEDGLHRAIFLITQGWTELPLVTDAEGFSGYRRARSGNGWKGA